VVQPRLDALSNLRDRTEDPRVALLRAEIFESLLWIHLGSDVGIFSRDLTRALYPMYLNNLFSSLRSIDPKEKANQGPVYVPHSNESRAFYTHLPRSAGILFEKAMSGEDIFDSESLKLSNAPAVQGLCQTLLLLYSAFATSPTVERFTYAVNFATELEWKRFCEVDCTPEEVAQAEFSGSGSPMALVLAGYLALWGYGSRCQDAFAGIEGREGVDRADLVKLQKALQEILRWRVNLSRTYPIKRFERIRSTVSDGIENQSRQPGVSRDAASIIQASMERSFSQLGLPVPAYA